jgi:multicomponent Na+:H+ antiporter subunit F
VTTVAIALALAVLLVALGAGLTRVLRGPSRFDRMVGVQFSTTGLVAALVLLTVATGNETYIDVALFVALFAAVAGIALVQRARRGS